jgi:Cu(I)/Ag(I) efflux system periplasmic protein CusF
MKRTALLLSLTLLGASVFAQHAGHHTPAAASATPSATATTPAADAAAPAAGDAAWSEAEVRRVDARNGKITLKHGDIVNLGMPPMTMVFTAEDPASIAPLKVGDRVRFTADQIKGVYTVLRIEPLP